MRLFLDANVLFTAAHNPKGKAAHLFELAEKGHWEVATSTYAINETRRNLLLKHPSSVARLDSLLEQVHRAEHHPGLFYPTSLTAKDRPIFQAALACGATHLLTGDLKDFGEFMGNPDKTKGIRIMTIAVFLRSVRSQYDLGRGIRTSPH